MANRMVGNKAPDFKMLAVSGDASEIKEVSLADYKGKWLVLFFYPRDFTFVCPTEIRAMSGKCHEFQKIGAEILGVSTDSEFSHKSWITADEEKGGIGYLQFPLAADTTHEVSKDYGVFIEETGAALRGLFIINPEGELKYQVVHDLNVGRSVNETLRVLQALQAGGMCPMDWEPGDDML